MGAIYPALMGSKIAAKPCWCMMGCSALCFGPSSSKTFRSVPVSKTGHTRKLLQHSLRGAPQPQQQSQRCLQHWMPPTCSSALLQKGAWVLAATRVWQPLLLPREKLAGIHQNLCCHRERSTCHKRIYSSALRDTNRCPVFHTELGRTNAASLAVVAFWPSPNRTVPTKVVPLAQIR